MKDITITLTKDEMNMVMGALAYYMLAGFPMGRSSYSHGISRSDRKVWAKLGMDVWAKLNEIQKAS